MPLLERFAARQNASDEGTELSTELIYQQSEILIVLALAGLLVLSGEIGYRLGRRPRKAPTVREETQFVSIEVAVLALLSLLLGFTFAMALSRFELRKEMVVRESNAIGTAALRSQLLPASHQDEVSELFRRYVEIRLDAVLRTKQFSPARRELDAETTRLQARLWKIAATAAATDPRSVPLGLFAHAVNELIDINAHRDVAVANHVPESVLLSLFGFAVLAAGILGYGNALAGARIRTPAAIYSVVVVLVILLILDLDRPQEGLARVSQESMIQLQTILNSVKQ